MGGGVRDKQTFVRRGAQFSNQIWSFAVFPAGKMGAFATKAKLLSKRQLATGSCRKWKRILIKIYVSQIPLRFALAIHKKLMAPLP